MAGKTDAARAALRNVDKLRRSLSRTDSPGTLTQAGVLLNDDDLSGNGGPVRAQSFSDARRNAVVTATQAASADPRNVEMLRIVRANARRLRGRRAV